MNLKEYINSGIVESYVLGLATEAERIEFEQLCATHPELVEARESFEDLLQEQLMADAVAPPLSVKQKILATINPSEPEVAPKRIEHYETPVRSFSAWKLMAAASLLLLIATGYWAFTTSAKNKELLARQQQLESELEQSSRQLQSLQSDAAKLYDPGMKMVALKGTDVAPQAFTTVYWDTTGTNKDVYLMINNLPQPANDKQYQLWALLDGKPIDLGVFDYDVRQKRLLVKMQNVQNAQAFAITLEKKGGNAVPEGSVYVVGEL